MIIKPFPRHLKAAVETIAKTPTSILPPPSFFVSSNNDNDIIDNMRDFVTRVPQVVKKRKDLDIQPGCSTDPVANLFR
jgi:hypothetical protein